MMSGLLYPVYIAFGCSFLVVLMLSVFHNPLLVRVLRPVTKRGVYLKCFCFSWMQLTCGDWLKSMPKMVQRGHMWTLYPVISLAR